MLILILGLVLFLGTHAFSMARARRARVIGEVGEGRYKLAYTLTSLLGLVLIGYGFHLYRESGYIAVWDPPVWTRHLALLLTALAFVALASAYLPGHIRARAKHPMLLAVKIWATAHLLANGDLGSILLFGSFLAWAVIARISAKRRALAPGAVVAQHAGPAAAPAGWRNDALAVVIGLAVWFAFARYLHPLLIGVAAWPGQA
ncbi:NnrU family protein [Methylobacterium sp. Leaf104]|uniref:NnrU family protein n=1 Tax=Methylobacterium TaxID=407 RepID=UPI0006F23215|nr:MULTISPECIES: NnrU family protein [Methylobacterium]KQP42844.1 NnrU family protein [Methylobacterium sp. Leaf104]MCI9878568.1 NnrU family protein [Methylobacterium goesingense]